MIEYNTSKSVTVLIAKNDNCNNDSWLHSAGSPHLDFKSYCCDGRHGRPSVGHAVHAQGIPLLRAGPSPDPPEGSREGIWSRVGQSVLRLQRSAAQTQRQRIQASIQCSHILCLGVGIEGPTLNNFKGRIRIRDVNEARTLEAEAEARTLEAEAEARTLEAEARTLEAEARTLEAKVEAKAEFIQFWPSEL